MRLRFVGFGTRTNVLELLESGVAQDGSAGRLRGIIIKLRLISKTPAAVQASQELARALEDYRHSDRVTHYWLLAILAAMFGGVGYWIWGS